MSTSLYKHHRFPAEIIQHAVWLYYRFNLSGRDIEDLLAERGIAVSYESIRLWCIKFGIEFSKRLRRRHQGYGDTFFIDEVFVKIQGKQHYLWREVNQGGPAVSEYTRRSVHPVQFRSTLDIGRSLSAIQSAKPALGVQRAFASWNCATAS